jgi:hypothetical protein
VLYRTTEDEVQIMHHVVENNLYVCDCTTHISTQNRNNASYISCHKIRLKKNNQTEEFISCNVEVNE